MIGKVIYYDGTTEPIVWYSCDPHSSEVRTPSGRYAYNEWIEEHDTGYKYRSHAFWTYIGWPDKWVCNVYIKEFQIMEGNSDEQRKAD